MPAGPGGSAGSADPLGELASDPSVPGHMRVIASEDPPSIALLTDGVDSRRFRLRVAAGCVIVNMLVVTIGLVGIDEPYTEIPLGVVVVSLLISVYFLWSAYIGGTEDQKLFEVNSSHVWIARDSERLEVKIPMDKIDRLELHNVQKMMEPGTIETVSKDCIIQHRVDGNRQELSLVGGEVGSAPLLLKSVNWFRPDLNIREINRGRYKTSELGFGGVFVLVVLFPALAAWFASIVFVLSTVFSGN